MLIAVPRNEGRTWKGTTTNPRRGEAFVVGGEPDVAIGFQDDSFVRVESRLAVMGGGRQIEADVLA